VDVLAIGKNTLYELSLVTSSGVTLKAQSTVDDAPGSSGGAGDGEDN
jgi:hypothetical protein